MQKRGYVGTKSFDKIRSELALLDRQFGRKRIVVRHNVTQKDREDFYKWREIVTKDLTYAEAKHLI